MDYTTGKLRHRVTIQTINATDDTAGQPIPDWDDVDTVWGCYEATGGIESVSGEQVRSIISGIVTIRRYDGLTPKHRLKVNGWGIVDLVLNIAAVHPPDPNTGLQTIAVRQPEEEIVQ